MKNFLFLLATLISLTAFGQVPGDLFSFVPFVTSRVHASDSVQVQFVLATNSTTSPSIAITQTGGPTVKFTPANNWIEGSMMTTTFWLQGLAPGNYAFTAVGKSGSGTTSSQVATLTVVADPVIPVCPIIPPPRTVTGVTYTAVLVNGVWGIKQGFTFSDGGTQ